MKNVKKSRGYGRLKLLVLILAIVAVAVAGLAILYQVKQSPIKLNGESEMTISLNGIYDEPGATARIDGEDFSDKIKIDSNLNTAKPGEYTIKYSLEDYTAKRTVKVTDEMNPVLELAGDDSLDVKLGEKFRDPGYKATDKEGNDITGDVKVSYEDLNKAGKCRIAYTVEDSNGNATRVFRDVTVKPNTDYKAPGLPICMYHYVYDENNPPEDLHKRFGNYISAQALEKELNWLNKEGYYYPTWKEVREYIDGKLKLPEKSIVLCFDDGSKSFLENGIPVLEKCKVPATCFMITSSKGKAKIARYQSEYVSYESHSHNMHRPGGNIGHGGIFTAISHEKGMADLKKSVEICGSSDVFAYPYGDYNDSSLSMIKETGFLCAVTTQPGKAKPGDDPLLLPRVRMSLGQSLESFQKKVQP
ncbi:MAG: polysaccharide deacetylase family protein [Bacillota bacterium]|nr:polysaccharide deacetylase family protein [Bacillota bacterium]